MGVNPADHRPPFAGDNERAAPIFPGIPEYLTPFVYKLPFEYVACETSRLQNVPFLNFNNPKRQEVNFRQIFHSAETGGKRVAA